MLFAESKCNLGAKKSPLFGFLYAVVRLKMMFFILELPPTHENIHFAYNIEMHQLWFPKKYKSKPDYNKSFHCSSHRNAWI